MSLKIIFIYTYAADEEKDFFSFSLDGGLDKAATIGGATVIGVGTLLIIVGGATIFGDGGIRGWGICILLVCTGVDTKGVLILIWDPAGVFRGTALTSICRPPPTDGLGDDVDVSGGGSVAVWEDGTGGWIRIEPILLIAVRPEGVCTLTCCCNIKLQQLRNKNQVIIILPALKIKLSQCNTLLIITYLCVTFLKYIIFINIVFLKMKSKIYTATKI